MLAGDQAPTSVAAWYGRSLSGTVWTRGGWARAPPGRPRCLLATLDPDRGERQFYRDNPADFYVVPTVVDALPWESLRAVVVSADALAAGHMASTAAVVAQTAADRGVQVWWDLDLRSTSWTGRKYADVVPVAVEGTAVVVGTEEEFAAFLDIEQFIQHLHGRNPRAEPGHGGPQTRSARSGTLPRGETGSRGARNCY